VPDYYSTTLSGERLLRCYEVASPRVQQYLDEEARFVCDRLARADAVLELGCGYGRLVWQFARTADFVVGIDTSPESLRLAQSLAHPHARCSFARMDAARLAFGPGSFDVVVCAQNGVCAFHVDPGVLLAEALRVVRSSGRVLLSSYAERFWPDRLEWFRRQAAEGLVGRINEQATRPGTIVCEDGFTVGTMSPMAFRELCDRFGVAPTLTEVDGSSLFCEVEVRSAA
jgi:2-polyprenyl-6-hydroxyphenyl methylase/3-demethylubiquinone-9 3-methyltransferase